MIALKIILKQRRAGCVPVVGQRSLARRSDHIGHRDEDRGLGFFWYTTHTHTHTHTSDPTHQYSRP